MDMEMRGTHICKLACLGSPLLLGLDVSHLLCTMRLDRATSVKMTRKTTVEAQVAFTAVSLFSFTEMWAIACG